MKESNPAARPGAQSAMRGQTRYFRAAVARKYFVCPRIARQGQSGRLCFVQSTSPQSEDKSKNSARRGRLCDFSHLPGSNVRFFFCEIGFLEGIKIDPAARPSAISNAGTDYISAPQLRGNIPSGTCEKIGKATASARILDSPLWWLRSDAVRIGVSGQSGTDGTFPRNCGAKMSRQSPHCKMG